MGIKEGFAVMFGNGIDIAERQAEKMKLQAELTRTKSSIESAYADFGRSVVQSEGSNQSFMNVYGVQVTAIKSLEQRSLEIQQRISELEGDQRSGQTVPTGLCPACGTPVLVSAPRCPSCGNDLADLKVRYCCCPSCGTYYDAEVKFCMKCGTKTEPVSVVASQITARAFESGDQESVQEAQEEPVVPAVPTVPVCPECGGPVSPGDLFCGTCGTRLNG